MRGPANEPLILLTNNVQSAPIGYVQKEVFLKIFMSIDEMYQVNCLFALAGVCQIGKNVDSYS